MASFERPDWVRKSFKIISEVPILFAKVHLEAAADGFGWEDHANSDLIHYTMYREFFSGGISNGLPRYLHC